MKRCFLAFLSVFISFNVVSQILEPSSWSTTTDKTEVGVGEMLDIIFTAKINENWYLYSSDFDPDCGPMVTTFDFNADAGYERVGDIKAIDPIEKFDEIFECDVRIFKKTGEFRQTIKILNSDPNISGSYEFQVCSDVTGQCIPFDYEFSVDNLTVTGTSIPKDEPKEVENQEVSTETTAPVEEFQVKEEPENLIPPASEETENAEGQNIGKENSYSSQIEGPILDDSIEFNRKQDKSIIWFMVLAFMGGLAALLTPCVFPMIPMTVTYFSGHGKGKSQAFMYGISIVVIYTIIGSAIAPLMGPETANHLSTEWLPNLIFFLIFVVFALSFFGLFDINMPNSFVNKMDAKAEKSKGFAGSFFMAFTLVLVSFSCTGPIVGSILVGSAGGEFLKPILGMFAFSMAFAIPFTLFAIFPGWLNSLPKSGGWLNSVKVVLGFIELALAFKFLSIADQAFHWGLLDRDLNIAIWIVIFTLMGFYLLGKLRLPHDSKVEVTSVPRLILAIITFSFVIYLIPGLWGAPLKALAGYLPPLYTHDFNLLKAEQQDQLNERCADPLYDDFLHLPHGLNGYFDYEQAIKCARAVDKPLFIDFTGHGCTNCREMEAVVWSDPEVLRRLREDFIVVALYVDDKTELPEQQWYTSSYDNKIKKTIGKQNADLQIRRLNNNAQPFYILLGPDERVLVEPYAYNRDPKSFIEFLDKGIERHQSRYLADK